MKAQTTLSFTQEEDIWPLVESWAQNAKLIYQEPGTHRRLYRRASSLTCPAYFEIIQEGSQVTINGWVNRSASISPFATPIWAAVLPPQMELGSGGIVGLVPRTRARNILNQLLTALTQPLIA